MIARVWHGVVPMEKSDSYGEYLSGFGVRDYQSIPGNRGVSLLRRAEGNRVHFLLISFWESWAAIQAYAGTDVNAAHYYDYDKECLIEPEPTVVHYEVLAGPVITPS
jgi:heme-degrading monooxygenase HmoA